MDDLTALPRDRWLALSYEDLCRDPAATVRTLCEFGGIDLDAALAQHVSTPLPASRYTLTPPAPNKWRQNQSLIERVLPSVEDTWDRLRRMK